MSVERYKTRLHYILKETYKQQRNKLGACLSGCLFGLAVECANARLSTRPGLISCTEPGTNQARGAKIMTGAYVIGLISWAGFCPAGFCPDPVERVRD